MPPQAFEVGAIGAVRQEIFGRCCRSCAGGAIRPRVIDAINALGYGLTLGIQTRIDTARGLARAAHVGNVYINRNQIGAVVGVQPFGGEGLSAPARRPAARCTCCASAPSRR